MKIPKAVIMSIHPKWCDLIVQGKKTVELRKTKPQNDNLYPPFRVYIYCTKSPKKLRFIYKEDYITGEALEKPVFIKSWYTPKTPTVYNGIQKVIGYFTCRWFDRIYPNSFLIDDNKGYCLSETEIKKYLKDKDGYGWHIDNLVIYETPKTLDEFGLKRPPQSWCYVYDKNNFLKG